jgi:hypothetical protein
MVRIEKEMCVEPLVVVGQIFSEKLDHVQNKNHLLPAIQTAMMMVARET